MELHFKKMNVRTVYNLNWRLTAENNMEVLRMLRSESSRLSGENSRGHGKGSKMKMVFLG